MPVVPDFLERQFLLRLNRGPGPILDLTGALAYRAVSLAVRLGLFEYLDSGPLTPAQVAEKAGLDERGASLLLEALEPLGYVARRDGTFRNTRMTSRWMVRSAPGSVTDLFPYFDDLLERWGYLEETIRGGAPPQLAGEWMDRHPGSWRRYHAALGAVARILSAEIVRKVPLPRQARLLLDIGGGHGVYSIQFCRQHPALKAVVMDRAQAREAAEENILAAGLTGRIVFREANVFTEPVEGWYDVALMFNLVRIFSAERSLELFRKAAGIVKRGGLVVVLDEFGTGRVSPFSLANHRLKCLEIFNSTRGRTYSAREVAGWLEASGFRRPRTIPLRRGPGLGLVMAERAD